MAESELIVFPPSLLVVSLAAGAMAGTAVDTMLFPLDTIKTRLQSAQGFWKAGGFRGIYSGLSSALMGSAPSAALFFVVYDAAKQQLKPELSSNSVYTPLSHMLAASAGEMAACTVRVPTDVVKQRLQANLNKSFLNCVKHVFATNGFAGFYVAYWPTIFREVPFSCIQFPLYEKLKITVAQFKSSPVLPYEGALCGCIAGGIAAALTTPLDVVKTRVTLQKSPNGTPYKGFLDALVRIYREEGLRKLFSGIQPRVLWISAGGALFLGVYEQTKAFFHR